MYLQARRLMERGLGWIDLHLLACAKLASPNFTLDERLEDVADKLQLQN